MKPQQTLTVNMNMHTRQYTQDSANNIFDHTKPPLIEFSQNPGFTIDTSLPQACTSFNKQTLEATAEKHRNGTRRNVYDDCSISPIQQNRHTNSSKSLFDLLNLK